MSLPRTLFDDSELRGVLTEFSTGRPEQARIAKGMLFGIENSLKARKGRFAALVDPAIITARRASEQELRSKVGADPKLNAETRPAWDNIRDALDTYRGMRDRYAFTEGGQGFRSRLYGFAKTLVRRAARSKARQSRLPEYTNANFPIQRQAILSSAPIYPDLRSLR